MAKAKNHTNNIDSATLSSIEATFNSAFVKLFVTDYPISPVNIWFDLEKIATETIFVVKIS